MESQNMPDRETELLSSTQPEFLCFAVGKLLKANTSDVCKKK